MTLALVAVIASVHGYHRVGMVSSDCVLIAHRDKYVGDSTIHLPSSEPSHRPKRPPPGASRPPLTQPPLPPFLVAEMVRFAPKITFLNCCDVVFTERPAILPESDAGPE